MYGLPQACWIAHGSSIQHLAPYGFHPTETTPGLWTHDNLPITFTLVIETFGVRYYGKEHALHLKSALEGKYKVTTDWYGKLYIRISLTRNYDEGTVQLPIPVYVRAAFHLFQHDKTKRYQVYTTPVQKYL